MNCDDFKFEKLNDKLFVCVSGEHRFGTDAFLLAHFSQARRKDSVCDFCSGNGIVALLLEKLYSPKKIYAVEMQDKALWQLEKSKERSKLLKLEACHGDIKDFKASEELDLITCNPPYKVTGTGIISESDADKIARHETLCRIEDVCCAAGKNLKFGGRLCITNRPERLADVLCAMREYKIEPKRIRFVSKEKGGAPWLMLVEGKKGAKPFMTVEKGLYIYEANGEYSEEMKQLYSID